MSEHDKAPEMGATLARALEATRRTFDGNSARARDTERRILEATRATKRMPKVFWLVPVAAAFVVSAALAGEMGRRLSELTSGWSSGGSAVGAAPSSSGAPANQGLPAPPRETPLPLAPSVSVAPELGEPVPSARVSPTPPLSGAAPPVVPTVVSEVRPSPSSSPPAQEAVGELALYKAAHRAHFVEHDFARALAGWDRYLAAAPRGTFTLEARYNRAIALHRLGRRAEAVEALRPFANGAYGRYRRDEAQQLIEELR